jgi:Sortase domain
VLPASPPLAIAIPAIGVQSPLLHLGQTAQGELEVPAPGPNYNEAAWYRYSPTPGSLGPAVIIGHIDSAQQGPSVFYRLGSLRPHDTVLITRADGSVAIFAVDGVRRYHKIQFPTQLVYGNTNHAALRLISCGGPFDPNTGSYLDNIVVLASLVRASGARPTTGPPVS